MTLDPVFSGISRRELLKRCGCGFGYLALADLLAAATPAVSTSPMAPRNGHHAPKAKRVIFLFMHGGPSQVDTFDPKPKLKQDDGKPLPVGADPGPSMGPAKLLGSPWEFHKHGQSGLEISSVFPELGSKCADELCVIRSMHTDGPDHGQAVLHMHTGNPTLVRPSMGAWIVYGLGTVNQSLPGFITICPTPINGGPQNYGTAFLPAVYQATAIGAGGQPVRNAQIRNIRNARLPLALQREQLDLIQAFNRNHLSRTQADTQLEGVIESYELAFRMQTEAPQLTDISDESAATLALYGIDQQPTDDFGRQCLLARRFVERGVRFIQVSHSFKWDQHQNLKGDLERNAREVDRPIAGLLQDLKQRGLLKDTLVLWGGEFGRTPTVQPGADGRDHNPGGFSVWLAGGGIKGGMAYGSTDDYGRLAVDKKVHTHDLHATLLHQLGLDHTKLTYRYAGRDFRLTDVAGNVVRDIIA